MTMLTHPVGNCVAPSGLGICGGGGLRAASRCSLPWPGMVRPVRAWEIEGGGELWAGEFCPVGAGEFDGGGALRAGEFCPVGALGVRGFFMLRAPMG
jgi:hypothetical protein